VTVAGETYDLSFYLRARSGSSSTSNSVKVLWNNVEVGVFNGDSSWAKVSLQLIGTGFDTLSFVETIQSDDGRGSHLDNISLIGVVPLN